MLKTLQKTAGSIFIIVLSLSLLKSCSAEIPAKAEAVKNFDSDRYLGKWYEIARIDFKYEKDLDQVTANYSKKENGRIKVDNQGYNYVEKKWKQSIGEAKFVGSEKEARLKVSFFKPFWAGYNVIKISNDYQYALVAGKNLDYLWILSREKTIPAQVKNEYLKHAQNIGYDTSRLVWVKQ